MKLKLIQKEDKKYAESELKKYYEGNLLPAEKKQYLTDLKSSHGPYMGIVGFDKKPHYLMDAASQIATLGLGFNSSVFLGPAHHLESWTNENHTHNAKALRSSFESFLKRKLDWNQLITTFCNSGAEANEIALGYCYKNRKNKKANKVLAFEGSFHGRMLVSLQATWNPSKREPFMFPGFEATFCSFPELSGDEILQSAPDNWADLWTNATKKEFSIPTEWYNDPQLKNEIDSLCQVRDELIKGDIFSIIIEPMQCEGGDRYASDRFNTALLLMARSFSIEVIFDEVQTGFHLGQEFFWHKMFNLKDAKGLKLEPDHVVCAKKAQIGLVLSRTCEKEQDTPDEYSMVSMIRGYYHGVALDQNQSRIHEIEKDSRSRLNKLIEKYSDLIARPRVMGLSFAFDILDKEKVSAFIAARFDHGLLYYPAGDKTLRFRLNTSFSSEDLDFLFERLDKIVSQVLLGETAELVSEVETSFRAPQNLYQWHEAMTSYRLLSLNQNTPSKDHIWKTCEEILTGEFGLPGAKLVKLTNDNFDKYKTDIDAIQKEVYEPTRQTELKNFELSTFDKGGVSLLLILDNHIQAMAISGVITKFPNERILKRDPDFNNSKTLYMVDCTVRPGHREKGLGRQMKSALNLIAMSEGIQKVVGRNRDRMAGAMLSINLGLGAFEKLYVPEDYPDTEKHRDVFFYNNKLTWSDDNYRLDNALSAPLDSAELNEEFIFDQLPFLTNKVCLSNFVSLRYLDHFKELFSELPKELQHGYSASGQSECVDKVTKSMFVADKKRHKMISFHGHFFGKGSFMSRSLSDSCDPYFPVTHYDSPNKENWKDILAQIKKESDPNETLAIWLEPLPQNLLVPLPIDFLKELRIWCNQSKVNLVYNDTAASMYRFDEKNFCASTIDGIKPDAGFIFMGAQAAMVFANEDNFLAKPLMMISTWDGDEFSYASFTKSLKSIHQNREDFNKTRKDFENKIKSISEVHLVSKLSIHNGCGILEGDLPHELASLMTPLAKGKHKFLPTYGAMKKFLKDHK